MRLSVELIILIVICLLPEIKENYQLLADESADYFNFKIPFTNTKKNIHIFYQDKQDP